MLMHASQQVTSVTVLHFMTSTRSSTHRLYRDRSSDAELCTNCYCDRSKNRMERLRRVFRSLGRVVSGHDASLLPPRRPWPPVRAHFSSFPTARLLNRNPKLALAAAQSLTTPSAPALTSAPRSESPATWHTPSPAFCLWPPRSCVETFFSRSHTRIEQFELEVTTDLGCKELLVIDVTASVCARISSWRPPVSTVSLQSREYRQGRLTIRVEYPEMAIFVAANNDIPVRVRHDTIDLGERGGSDG